MSDAALVSTEKMRKIAKLAWGVLAWNLAVIVWGAFVRASGSGAGCGRHWPLCNGEVVPHSPGTATMIEAAHRATSGLALIAVIWLLVAARRALPKGHRVRKSAGWSTVFVFTEALVGAGLVLFELVAHDASMKRGLSMTIHLCNTFFLLAALALTAWWATVPLLSPVTVEETRKPLLLKGVITVALGSVLVLGASGAIAALGDTLFPALSLREGIAQDLSPLSHVFLKLRMLHPVIALGSGIVVLGAAGLVRGLSGNPHARLLSRGLTLLFVTQFGAGILNITLLAPIPMQLVHLLLADATWIVLVLMASEARTQHAAVPAALPSTPDVAAA